MTLFEKIRSLFSPGLSCEQANAFILDYVEGRMDPGLRARFEAHLGMCPSCAPFLDQYRQTMKLVHDEGQIEVPTGLTEHTLHFLREQRAPGAEGATT